MTITNEQLKQAFDVLTDNNFHNDTSILNCYLAFGLVPVTEPEHDKLWAILERLKRIDRKSYDVGYLTFQDIDNRHELNNQVKAIINKFSK